MDGLQAELYVVIEGTRHHKDAFLNRESNSYRSRGGRGLELGPGMKLTFRGLGLLKNRLE